MRRILSDYSRKSIRLDGYDYSKAGFYFVTICAKDMECLFGTVDKDRVIMSDFGRIIENQWCDIRNRYDSVVLDEFVVMPNHIHGIINISNVGATLAVARDSDKPPDATLAVARDSDAEPSDQAGTSPTRTEKLGDVIGSFKSLCVHEWLKIVKGDPLNKAANIWHRNYYDRIIRNEIELNKIRKYIMSNPKSWQNDEKNPENIK